MGGSARGGSKKRPTSWRRISAEISAWLGDDRGQGRLLSPILTSCRLDRRTGRKGQSILVVKAPGEGSARVEIVQDCDFDRRNARRQRGGRRFRRRSGDYDLSLRHCGRLRRALVYPNRGNWNQPGTRWLILPLITVIVLLAANAFAIYSRSVATDLASLVGGPALVVAAVIT